MKGFANDDDERAFVRSKLPPELLATVDNAELAMNARIDDTVKGFKETITAKMAAFTERDFAAELDKALVAEQDALVQDLAKSADNLKAQITALNVAAEQMAAEDPALKQLVANLSAAHASLDAKLQDTRTRVAKIGATAAALAKKAVSTALTGIL